MEVEGSQGALKESAGSADWGVCVEPSTVFWSSCYLLLFRLQPQTGLTVHAAFALLMVTSSAQE